jgi:ABC-type multidrug transport system ATPase subunit
LSAPSADDLLHVESLGVRAGSRFILQEATLRARAGEITAVIGPNGAGKTTLLEAIVGLRPVATGRVSVGGRDLVRFADHARAFSFLPDAGRLPTEATVETLVQHAMSLGARAKLAPTLRERLAIEPLLEKTIDVLSRGEHQRVALFCALVLERPIVALDEPFAAFDPLQLRSVFDVVRDVARASTAVIASIHQLGDAETIADRFLLLSGGRSIAFGDLSSLRARAGLSSGSLEQTFVALLEGDRDAP